VAVVEPESRRADEYRPVARVFGFDERRGREKRRRQKRREAQHTGQLHRGPNSRLVAWPFTLGARLVVGVVMEDKWCLWNTMPSLRQARGSVSLDPGLR
jgi:hypothetical protein